MSHNDMIITRQFFSFTYFRKCQIEPTGKGLNINSTIVELSKQEDY